MKIKPAIAVLTAFTLIFALCDRRVLAAGPENSDATIDFKEYTDVTDPKDPDTPLVPGPGPGTGQSGPLSLDYVPNLGFGQNDVSTGMVTSNTTSGRPYIQVTDLRGTGAGWRVSASLSSFKKGGTPSLNGAYLQLKNGDPISSYQTIPPEPKTLVVLESDNTPADVVTAYATDGGQGRGTWLIRWYPTGGVTDVQLVVPAASASTGTHVAIITWTLYDAP